MSLKLTLKPGEKFVVNGAVIENGDRRVTITIQNQASLLREKDIMLPEEANTPARRIYFAIMMLYLDEGQSQDLQDQFVELMTGFMDAISSAGAIEKCVAIIQFVQSGSYYKALTVCRELFDFEAKRLGNVSDSLST